MEAVHDTASNDLFANYLLGLNDNYIQGSAQDECPLQAFICSAGQLEAQSNLTLNFGLRWESTTIEGYRPESTDFPAGRIRPSILVSPLSQATVGRGVLPLAWLCQGSGSPCRAYLHLLQVVCATHWLAWSPDAKDGSWASCLVAGRPVFGRASESFTTRRATGSRAVQC